MPEATSSIIITNNCDYQITVWWSGMTSPVFSDEGDSFSEGESFSCPTAEETLDPGESMTITATFTYVNDGNCYSFVPGAGMVEILDEPSGNIIGGPYVRGIDLVSKTPEMCEPTPPPSGYYRVIWNLYYDGVYQSTIASEDTQKGASASLLRTTTTPPYIQLHGSTLVSLDDVDGQAAAYCDSTDIILDGTARPFNILGTNGNLIAYGDAVCHITLQASSSTSIVEVDVDFTIWPFA